MGINVSYVTCSVMMASKSRQRDSLSLTQCSQRSSVLPLSRVARTMRDSACCISSSILPLTFAQLNQSAMAIISGHIRSTLKDQSYIRNIEYPLTSLQT